MATRRTPSRAATAARSRRPLPLGRDDAGQSNVLLLFGLTLALLSLTLLFVRVGAANDQRSQVQTAADAAALAAVSALRDQAAQDLFDGAYPMPWFDEEKAEARAEEYARENGAVLTDIRASDNVQGRNGNIVRVEVRGAICQKELEEDGSLPWNDVNCDGSEEDADTVVGNASAIAIVHPPNECGRAPDGVIECVNGSVDSLDTALSMIRVNLVDQEGTYRFDPSRVFGGGAIVDCASLGQLHPRMCAVHQALQDEFGGFYLTAGGYRAETGSDHSTGEAIDYMMAPIGQQPTDEMDATAVTVIDWLIQNADRLGIKGIIYDRLIWNNTRNPPDRVGAWPGVARHYPHYGNITLDHVDHIHLAAGDGAMQ
ncbi:putative Flp pilus-assembly TadE/G-like protein [Nocardiopsis sp. Huas11]|uniref:pilus assembly protein TadG-related protein n=1 Tax=Nocardiopsis sp. Huas11 TaxID=2183912 RepID=UPI000EAD8165|nr:pilus assembly protein TadG-related protein [Nocardiopsis sp. Huas11]RKS10332.1 putative Flp pilus-assembly TadE/G-like protein [Nocardiopsis sp. Huas11]